MNNVEQLFEGEIRFILDNSNPSDLETNEYKARVDCATKLADRMLELEKFDSDVKAKAEERALADRRLALEEEKLKLEKERLSFEKESKAKDSEADISLKTKQLEDDNKDRFIRNCIAAGGIIIPVLVTIWGTKKSFEFEREGTITTIMGRGFINKLLPKK